MALLILLLSVLKLIVPLLAVRGLHVLLLVAMLLVPAVPLLVHVVLLLMHAVLVLLLAVLPVLLVVLIPLVSTVLSLPLHAPVCSPRIYQVGS